MKNGANGEICTLVRAINPTSLEERRMTPMLRSQTPPASPLEEAAFNPFYEVCLERQSGEASLTTGHLNPGSRPGRLVGKWWTMTVTLRRV